MRSPWVQICSTMVHRSPCDTRSSSTEWEVRDMASEQSARVRDASLSESTVEDVALDWLASLGWAVAHGPDIAPDTPAAERADYGTVVLTNRLRSALARELREENARGEELAGTLGGRAGLLRRPGDQRQRRPGARQRDAAIDRERAGGDCAWQRHHRLDATRECARQSSPIGQAHSAQARLPAGQTGESNPDGARTGRGLVRRLGGVSSYSGRPGPLQ